MINDAGRRQRPQESSMLSVDDGYIPAKTVEQTRKLVEQDGVALLFKLGSAATPTTRCGPISTQHMCRRFRPVWHDPPGGSAAISLDDDIFRSAIRPRAAS